MIEPNETSGETPADRFTAFVGERLIARGDLAQIARAVHGLGDAQPTIFKDATGHTLDLDLRGTADDAAARVSPQPPKPTRGRPKLGVTAREVTLASVEYRPVQSIYCCGYDAGSAPHKNIGRP